MPIFRSGTKIVYFAHIPKCGGSSIEDYIVARFGSVGFLDNGFTRLAKEDRWSRTSPQHIDWAALQRLVPTQIFSAVFTAVRHPVDRVVSAYHFQVDIEKSISPLVTFADWLRDQAAAFETDRFIIDNHFRPQVEFIPDDCDVFHLEHGLDAIVPYFDALAGDQDGPRFIGHVNQRGSIKGTGVAEPIVPTSSDLLLIEEIYAADFARFGYSIDRKQPDTPKPALAPTVLAASQAARAEAAKPHNRLIRRVRRKLKL